MSAFSQAVDVDGVAAYPATPQVIIPFEPVATLCVDEHASSLVDVSFDGVNDAGRLTPGVLAGVSWDRQGTRVWLKQSGGAVGAAVTVRVMAEK